MNVELRPLAIKRCLTNLVSNALRYGTMVQLQAVRGRTSVEITIDDNGPGIPPDKYEDVFRPFFRLDESRNVDTGGVGLGLTIARDVARSHGGDVALAPSPLGGLRVSCEFRSEDGAAPRLAPEPGVQISESNIREKNVQDPVAQIRPAIPIRRRFPPTSAPSCSSNPGFGRVFTDHMVTIRYQRGRGLARRPDRAARRRSRSIRPPRCCTTRRRSSRGSRPTAPPTAARRCSARTRTPAASSSRPSGSPCRSCPRSCSSRPCDQLVTLDRDWIPDGDGSLYIRPFMFANEAFLGVQPSSELPVPRHRLVGRHLLQVGRAGGVDLGLAGLSPAPRPAARAPPSAAATTPPAWCRRPRRRAQARPGRVPRRRRAASWIEELGGMNLFFVFDDGSHGHAAAHRHDPARHHPRHRCSRSAKDKGSRCARSAIRSTSGATMRRSGRLREAFACGTAAVVTPIGTVARRTASSPSATAARAPRPRS